MGRRWKRVRPTSLLNAIELNLEHARDKFNRGVDRVAEAIGEENHHNLYKWAGSGRMPLCKVRAFELACGANFVTRWLASSAGLMVIEVPTGKPGRDEDVLALQETLNDAVGALIQFYAGKADQAGVLARVTAGLEGLAYHRKAVEKHDQPELELEESPRG